jgi:Rps23 Pro-64 3,4-dihydroxylase Tpa1-like proline 4-hydroxylase
MAEIIVPRAPETGAPETGAPGTEAADADTALAAAPVAVVDDFLPAELAAAMRADIDAHFAHPDRHRGETHQVWNYWFVPELYTYLRTNPEKVIARPSVDGFMQALREWSVENLGMGRVTWPYLSLYVSGCRQGWHNDATNGRFAFVYSLTRDQRATTGGDTLVMREGDPLRRNMKRPAAGRTLFAAVPPKFNRLVIFDDRVPHAVERVDGVMDPVEGRFVLHGHLSEAGPSVSGARPAEQLNAPLNGVLTKFTAAAGVRLAHYQGPLSLRLTVDAAGLVAECDVMVDRVLHPDPADTAWETLREELCEQLEATRFPPASGASTVILPVMFGARPAAPR